MRRTLVTSAAAVATIAAVLASVALGGGGRPTAYELPGKRVFPEGVAFDPATNQFYVASIGTGAIYRGHIDRTAATVFLPGKRHGRTTAVGLKVRQGRLYVVGGGTGLAWVYDARSGALVRKFDTEAKPNEAFLNDVALAPNGDAYITDSLRPILYRIPAAEVTRGSVGKPEAWLNFSGTPGKYVKGFNINGLVATSKYVIVVNITTGKLFRIEIATKRVTEIDLGGEKIQGGDGLLLRGRILYAVANLPQDAAVVKVRLSADLSKGEVLSRTTNPAFNTPTTAAFARGRLLIPQAQFGSLFGENPPPPKLPFVVLSVPIP